MFRILASLAAEKQQQQQQKEVYFELAVNCQLLVLQQPLLSFSLHAHAYVGVKTAKK
jgi:hypothetical protein